LVLELTAGREVLPEAADIAVGAVACAICLEWSSLLGDCLASEWNLELSEGEIVGVEDPRGVVDIGIRVPLLLGRRADNHGLGKLAGLNQGTLTNIGLVDGVDQVRRTERWLGNGNLEGDRARRRNVGDAELEGQVGVLRHVAEVQGRATGGPSLPTRAVWSLQLDESLGGSTSVGLERDKTAATVRGDVDVQCGVARRRRVVAKGDDLLRLVAHSSRQVVQGEEADLRGVARRVGGDEGTLSTDLGEAVARDGEGSLAFIGQDNSVDDGLSSDNRLGESDGCRGHGQESAGALTGALEADRGGGRIPAGIVRRFDEDGTLESTDLAGLEVGLEGERSAGSHLSGDDGRLRGAEVGRSEREVGNGQRNLRRAGDRLLRGRHADIGGAKVGAVSAGEGRVSRSTECIDEPLVGAKVDNAVTEVGAGELVDAWRVEALDERENLAVRDGAVDAERVALRVGIVGVRNPEETSARLAVERCDRSVADTEAVIALTGLGDASKGGLAIHATELENAGLEAVDADVHIAALERIVPGTRVHRVLVVVASKNTVGLAGTGLVAAQIIEIEEVGVAVLPCGDTNTLNGTAGEGVGRKHSQRAGSQVEVSTIQVTLVGRHEKVLNVDGTFRVHRHVNDGLLERRRRLTTVDRDVLDLTRVTVAGDEEHGTLVVRRETTTRHPNTGTLLRAVNSSTLGGVELNDLAGALVPADNVAGEVVVDAVRSIGGIDVGAALGLKQTGALVLDTAIEGSRRVVTGTPALEVDGEVGALGQVVDVDGVDVDSTIRAALRNAGLALVQVGLGGKIQSVGIRVDDTRADNTDGAADIRAEATVFGYVSESQARHPVICGCIQPLPLHAGVACILTGPILGRRGAALPKCPPARKTGCDEPPLGDLVQ
jgi:hypothetical protein